MARRFGQASPYLLILFGESNVLANLQSFPVENVALAVLLLQKMCSDEWRPSRVESECVVGDGVTFYYPDAKCSPFLGRPTGIYTSHHVIQYTLL